MVKVFRLAVFILFGMGLAQSSFALQIKPIFDNGSTQAYISVKGLTRISVENDRILNFRGPEGAYYRFNDNNAGAVFVQPTPAFQKKAFTVFISTENNHNYVLRLIPRNQNADMILLQSLNGQNPMAAHWETSSPYTQTITRLTTAMVNQTPLEGYGVYPVIKAKTQYLGNIAAIKLTEVYSGAYLQGFVYCVTNRTSQPLVFNEREFYQSGDRSISLTDLNVPPHGQTWLYKVRSRG